MSHVLRIALRYIRPRRLSFIGIITTLSVMGIVIGVAALICVMSIFNGFRDLARDLMVSFDPHVRVIATRGMTLPASVNTTSHPILARAIPITEARMAVMVHGATSVLTMRGVEDADARRLTGPANSVVVGTWMTNDFDHVPSVVIGAGLAETLECFLGDTLTLLSASQVEQALMSGIQPSGRRAIVRGIFQSNSSKEVDRSVAFTSAALVRSLTSLPGPTALDLRLDSYEQAADVATALRSALGPRVSVLTWYDLHKSLYDVMDLERLGSFVVLTLIILVAVFNILVSLTLTVVEKRRDIAILKTMGATDGMIRNVYLLQGALIGMISVGVGTALGLGLCLGQQHYSWIAFDLEAGFLVSALPLRVQTLDVVVVACTGLILSSLAAIYPAHRAARSRVIDGIRG
ncbi:MAG: ABC transporter permease [Bacteroidetes bacterium]|nr:ABC transporter permease [Bacteroidota bacterium]